MSLLIEALDAADRASRAAPVVSPPSSGAQAPESPRGQTAPSSAAPQATPARAAHLRMGMMTLAVAAAVAVAVGAWIWWSSQAVPPPAPMQDVAVSPTAEADPAETPRAAGDTTQDAPDAQTQRATPQAPVSARPVPDTRGVHVAGPQPRPRQPAPKRHDVAPAIGEPAAPAEPPLIRSHTTNAPLREAYAALNADRLDEAERLYREAARLHPQHPDVLLGLAAIAERRGDRAAALAGYARVLEIEPEQPEALAAVTALKGRGDAAMLESALRLALARQPQSVALHRALGRALARQDRWSEAHAAFVSAWRLDPDQPDYAYDVAVALDRLRRPAEAAAMYRQALDLLGRRTAAVGFDADAARARAAVLQEHAQRGLPAE